MTNQSRLIPISYYNKTQEVRLSAYADTIVYEQESRQKTLRAIRFGGYPEMVRAMADALYAGATLEAQVGGTPFETSGGHANERKSIWKRGISWHTEERKSRLTTRSVLSWKK